MHGKGEGIIFISLLFIAVGAWGIFSPYTVWLIFESWKSDDADGPSTFFIWTNRIGSWAFVIAGLIGIIVSLT
ncbi:DUF6199 family natural product biosynthesis protein [Halobacillus litoralis]|uniref:DUF6199 family natural product biosynthesis protein n=1 Tax=Halobacillus litoralis TaxID=45668 RepID=UPI0039907C0F